MSEPLGAILLWLLIVGSLAGGVYHALVVWRIRRAMFPRPSLCAGLRLPAPPAGWPRVTIVVPAHNEAEVIGGLARSIRGLDYPNFTVVFALDRCDDDTAAVVRAALDNGAAGPKPPPFDVVRIDACPADWHGKPHAVHTALERSPLARDADLLLFVDADTRFEPACLKAAVGLLRERGLGLLSLLSSLDARRWWERAVQPWAAFELMRKHPIDRVNRKRDPIAFANGQFMLFTRAAYEQVGGHEAVRRHVLEDIALATRCVNRGVRTQILLADGLFHCRMYRTWSAFRAGWKRIYTEGFRLRVKRLRTAGYRLAVAGVLAPMVAASAVLVAALRFAGIAVALGKDQPADALLLAAGLLGLLAWLLAAAVVLRAQRASLGWLLAAPFGALQVVRLLLASARDLKRGRQTRWAGRSFVRAERR